MSTFWNKLLFAAGTLTVMGSIPMWVNYGVNPLAAQLTGMGIACQFGAWLWRRANNSKEF